MKRFVIPKSFVLLVITMLTPFTAIGGEWKLYEDSKFAEPKFVEDKDPIVNPDVFQTAIRIENAGYYPIISVNVRTFHQSNARTSRTQRSNSGVGTTDKRCIDRRDLRKAIVTVSAIFSPAAQKFEQ